MRTTVLERLEARRIVPYDRDDHSILDKDGNFQFEILDVTAESIIVGIRFRVEVKSQSDQRLWGFIDGEAKTTITSDALRDAVTADKITLPAEFGKIIEGAISEDLFLPISQTARLMHLPSLLVSPISIGELEFERVSAEKTNDTAPEAIEKSK